MRFLSLVCVSLLGFVLIVHAQDTKPAGKPMPPAEPPKSGESPFSEEPLLLRDAEKPTQKDFTEFRRFVSGASANPIDKALIAKMAKWLVYRLTWTEIQEGRDVITIDEVMKGNRRDQSTVDGIERAIPLIPSRPPTDPDEKVKRDRQRVYLQEFTTAVRPPLREVMKNRLIARVNGARAYLMLIDAGQEEVADDLIQLIENPAEHEAVRHFAFQGLRRLFALPKIDAKRAERCGLVLCRELEARCKVGEETLSILSPPEVDGLRFVRRELIRGLGAMGRPLVVDVVPQKGQPIQARREGPAAELLLRVMNNQKVSPEPSWQERAEAAAALCQLKHKTSPSYQPEFVIHELGRFVAEMAAEVGNNKDQRWKYFAVVLRNGTEELAKDLATQPPHPAAEYLKRMAVVGRGVLDYVYDPKGAPEHAELNRWLNQNKPKAATPYAAPATPS